MIDPADSQTLDLVEACERPLTGAERAKRLRKKRKEERAAGVRAQLDLKAPELAVLSVALNEFRERWQQVPSKLRAAEALLPRLPVVSIADAFPGDSGWLPDVAQQIGVYPNYVAQSAFSVDSSKCHSPLSFRQTPLGQPEVDALVQPGDMVWTSYDSGPYLVKTVTATSWNGLRSFSLTLANVSGKRDLKGDAWINELVAVDGRLLKLFANNYDEVFIAARVLENGYVEASELEAVRGLIERERKRLLHMGKPVTFDALVFSLLGLKDKSLLEWARRNRQLIRETPPDQAYPSDPEHRNLLGVVLNDKRELNASYQRALETAMELYRIVDLEKHRLRVSSPASFLRTYKRDSEFYAAAGNEWAADLTRTFAQQTTPARNDWQRCAEKADADHQEARDEMVRLREIIANLRQTIKDIGAAVSTDLAPAVPKGAGQQQRPDLQGEGFKVWRMQYKLKGWRTWSTSSSHAGVSMSDEQAMQELHNIVTARGAGSRWRAIRSDGLVYDPSDCK